MAKQTWKGYRVNSLPLAGDTRIKQANRFYLNVGGGKFKTYIVNNLLQLTTEAGAEFIECDTMEQMRSLDARQIWAIQNGYYKGVKLNGYYEAGDTPAPIEYLLSDTTDADDGGSVIEVGDVKLVHEFDSDYNLKYFGLRGLYSFDGFDPQTDKAFNATEGKMIVAPNGDILFVYRKTAKGWHNHNDGNVYYKRSLDEGKTWGEETQITTSVYDTRNFIVGVVGNNISLVYRNFNVGGTPASLGCESMYSSNNGLTWSTPVAVDAGGTASVIPFGKVLKRNGYSAFIMYGQGVPNSQCHMYTSTDGITWTARSEALYNLTGFTVAEPVIEDLPDGSSIIIARNGAGGNGENFYQFVASDGFTFGTPVATNLYSDTSYARAPAWIEYIGNNEILVLVNSRIDAVSDSNLDLGMRAYIGDINTVKTNPNAYLLTHKIPRIFRSTSVTYGYPSLVKTSYGYVGCLTERRYVDEALKTLSSLYENEADDIQIFRFVKEAKQSFNVFGNSQIKNVDTGNPDYVTTDNDVFSSEENFSQHIWKASVQDPTNSGVLSFAGRSALLQSFNNVANSNWPQASQGGLTILAQATSRDDGVKWLIGRGNSNNDQGYLFVNTYASNTKVWSGWKRLALSDDIAGLTDGFIKDTIVTNVGWNDVDKGKIGFYYSLDGAPTGTGYFGLNIPSSTSGQFSVKFMFRNNRAFLRFTESGVQQPDLELVNKSMVASVTVQGLVELATGAETNTGTDDTRAVTPLGLQSLAATSSKKGLVNQSAALTNSAASLPTADTASVATDVPELLVDFNDLLSKYNSLLTVVTELQSKLNSKLANDRASGQQA